MSRDIYDTRFVTARLCHRTRSWSIARQARSRKVEFSRSIFLTQLHRDNRPSLSSLSISVYSRWDVKKFYETGAPSVFVFIRLIFVTGRTLEEIETERCAKQVESKECWRSRRGRWISERQRAVSAVRGTVRIAAASFFLSRTNEKSYAAPEVSSQLCTSSLGFSTDSKLPIYENIIILIIIIININ